MLNLETLKCDVVASHLITFFTILMSYLTYPLRWKYIYEISKHQGGRYISTRSWWWIRHGGLHWSQYILFVGSTFISYFDGCDLFRSSTWATWWGGVVETTTSSSFNDNTFINQLKKKLVAESSLPFSHKK